MKVVRWWTFYGLTRMPFTFLWAQLYDLRRDDAPKPQAAHVFFLT